MHDPIRSIDEKTARNEQKKLQHIWNTLNTPALRTAYDYARGSFFSGVVGFYDLLYYGTMQLAAPGIGKSFRAFTPETLAEEVRKLSSLNQPGRKYIAAGGEDSADLKPQESAICRLDLNFSSENHGSAVVIQTTNTGLRYHFFDKYGTEIETTLLKKNWNNVILHLPNMPSHEEASDIGTSMLMDQMEFRSALVMKTLQNHHYYVAVTNKSTIHNSPFRIGFGFFDVAEATTFGNMLAIEREIKELGKKIVNGQQKIIEKKKELEKSIEKSKVRTLSPEAWSRVRLRRGLVDVA